jgi:hypothetical protein
MKSLGSGAGESPSLFFGFRGESLLGYVKNRGFRITHSRNEESGGLRVSFVLSAFLVS